MSTQTESQWVSQVEDLARIGGWRTYRVTNSTREIMRRGGTRVRVRNVNASGVGFPDMVLVHARRRLLLFVELKRGRRTAGGTYTVTQEQKAWLADLRAVADRPTWAGTEPSSTIGVYVWTPENRDEVVSVLTGRSDQ